MSHYPIEALLRPPVEWSSSLAAVSLAAITWRAPDLLMMTHQVAWGVSGGLVIWALVRFYQGWKVVRYQRGLRQTRKYTVPLKAIAPDPRGLFLGRGFLWTAQHTQRLWDATRAENRRFVEPAGKKQREAAFLESGLPAIHGVGGKKESRIVLPHAERQGHLFYLGTTGVGKTRALELAIRQDIRRGHPVICLDPKGDPELFRCLHAEAQRVGRPFYFFHLGYPEHSARYNPIGRFSRLTEVATRIANQLPGQGNSEAFRQFAWLFTHLINQALFALGERPDYRKTLQYMSHIDPLLVRYFEHWLDRQGPPSWRTQIAVLDAVKKIQIPRHLQNRDHRAVQLVRFYKEHELYDPVADGLRQAFEYEKTFFDRISLAVRPMLEKLLAGQVGELINPDYSDENDPRPILDWPSVVRQRAVVYCGFDALTDSEVATAVSQGMLADLVALAGEIYKHGLGAQQAVPEAVPETCVHIDEFAEAARGREIIQALNKGRGAGLRFALYAQALADIAAGFGNQDQAKQVVGNVSNTLIMLRVADLETAELLTKRLGKVEVNMLMQVSGATDSSNPESTVHFTSNTQDRLSTQNVPLLEPGHLMQLPRGHAFVLMRGGQVFKVQFPEITGAPPRLPRDLEQIARDMAQRYQQIAGAGLQSSDSINHAALQQPPASRSEWLPEDEIPSVRPPRPPKKKKAPAAPPEMHWAAQASQWYVPASEENEEHPGGGR